MAGHSRIDYNCLNLDLWSKQQNVWKIILAVKACFANLVHLLDRDNSGLVQLLIIKPWLLHEFACQIIILAMLASCI